MSYYISHSGKRINIANIMADDIRLSDIAHHLTKICRYGGALELNQHYSVAQHSLALAWYAEQNGYSLDVQRALLMHDATEAYLGDIVSGLKKLLPDYKDIESKVYSLIMNKYNIKISEAIDNIIKELDTRIVLDEVLCFIPHYYDHFKAQISQDPLGVQLINETDLKFTYKVFLLQAENLKIGD